MCDKYILNSFQHYLNATARIVESSKRPDIITFNLYMSRGKTVDKVFIRVLEALNKRNGRLGIGVPLDWRANKSLRYELDWIMPMFSRLKVYILEESHTKLIIGSSGYIIGGFNMTKSGWHDFAMAHYETPPKGIRTYANEWFKMAIRIQQIELDQLFNLAVYSFSK